MLSKLKDNIILYAPVYLICVLLFGWLLISLFENYYLISLYPLYVAVTLTGLGMLKYQDREINQTPRYALEMESRLFPKFIIGGFVIIGFLYIFNVLAWELLVLPFLVLVIFCIRLSLVNRQLKKDY